MADTSSHTSGHDGLRIGGPPPRRGTGPAVLDEVPDRVLAVYAHPDDPEISCGGTLASWAGAGAEVHVLVCARGEKGCADPGPGPDEVARLRTREMEEAGAVLGLAGRRRLDLDDGDLANTPSLRRDIVTAVRDLRPDVVLCPDPTAIFFGDTYFNHADHRVVGWATLDAVSPAAANARYFPEAGPAHRVPTVLLSGTLEPNAWVDVSGTLDVKVHAVLRHASQFAEGAEWIREVLAQRAADGGRVAGVTYAEGFRRLSMG